MKEKTTEQLIEEAVQRFDKQVIVPNGYITLGTGENRYYDEEMAKIVMERVKQFLRQELHLIAIKSAEEERSKCWELDEHQSSEFRYHLNQLIFAINHLGEIDPTIYVREAQKALSKPKEL